MAITSTTILLFAIISLFFHSTWAQSKTYIVHMDKTAIPKAFSSHQSWFHSTLASISESSEIPISSKLIHTYTNSMHGFSATLTPSELEALKSLPGYLHSFPDQRLKLHTTHTPKFLGLSHNSGIWPASSYGKDVVIGVIDSGVWPESPSFRDDGMTKVPARWRGGCEEAGEGFNSSLCNKKLIGARFFNKGLKANYPNVTIANNSVRDDYGHGTHCASTAAGNFVEGASYFGYAKGTASGTAPRARVAIYKAHWGTTVSSDFIAAVDKAIADGVDVLSVSLGVDVDLLPPDEDYVLSEDWLSIATFGAMERGIFLSYAAGNDGPKPWTATNGAPWITTVAAGTVDRRLQGELVLGNGVRFSFVTLYPGSSSNPQVGLVFLKACSDVKLMSKFRNKIVVCQGDQTINDMFNNTKQAKVYGAVIITNLTMFTELIAENSFPKVIMSPKEGKIVTDYIKRGENPTGWFEFRRTTLLGTKPAPRVAVYSSRGPFRYLPSLLKPDIMAPGSLILAAWPAATPIATLFSGKKLHSDFNVISGTSMATPHVSGLAALIKSVHPKWSPAAIRSAMMTTADPLDNTQSTIKDEAEDLVGLDNPALGGGAGHVVPNKAIDPGLIYDLTPEDYIAFLCGLNYTAKQIQIITKSKQKCVKRSSELNYPSFLAYFSGIDGGGQKVVKVFRRTLTNVGNEGSSYTAKLTAMSELKLKVEPTMLVFKKKYEKLSYKLTIEGPTKLSVTSVLGSLSWVEDSGKYVVRSPIVATNINPKTFG